MGAVINIFSKNKQITEEIKEVQQEETSISDKFEELIKLNKENAERIKKERAQANKNVKKSYRLE